MTQLPLRTPAQTLLAIHLLDQNETAGKAPQSPTAPQQMVLGGIQHGYTSTPASGIQSHLQIQGLSGTRASGLIAFLLDSSPELDPHTKAMGGSV